MCFRWKLLTTILAWLAATPMVAQGQALTAMWDPNSPTDDVSGYEVCTGTASASCNSQRATVSATENSYTFGVQPGVLYYVAVRAVNGGGASPFSSEIRVSIPSLAQPPNQTSTANVPISALALTASDPDGGTLQFSHSGLPFGVSLNSSTGIITGTPTTAGTYTVTVFVTDGLETTSRSFVWTIQPAATSDTTAPTLTITSHSAGQTVTTASITLSGSASDSGSGGSGISNVAVNGAAATGGSATGINTANWSRSVALVAGANTIAVEARDGANNLRASFITVNRSVIAPLAVSFTSNVASPQVVGTTVTFTAAAAGGTAPYQFKWWVFDGTAWWIVQEWSTSATLNWRPTRAGNYIVAVWGRNAGVTADASQAMTQVNYLVSQPAGAPPPLSITTLTSTLASPQAANTSIGFTAGASGGTGPYQFKWWVFDGTAWWIVQEWSTSATLNWRPTRAGRYIVAAWARNYGVTADASQALAQMNYVISSPSQVLPVITSFTSNVASPAKAGTNITFSAAASEGVGTYQFKWWELSGGAWYIAQDWSSSATLTLRPSEAGTYTVAVWVRNQGVTADASQAMAQLTYWIKP